MECPLGYHGKKLSGPCTTVTQEWDNSTKKMIKKLSKMCSTQRNNESGSSLTHKKQKTGVACPLRNDGETLKRLCVTVTQEWDSSTKIMNKKKGPKTIQ